MHIYTIESGEFSLVAATAKTVLQLVLGATRRAKILEIGVSLESITSTDQPGLVELRKQSTAGTSTSFTPNPVDAADPAAIQTALNTFTAEPTDVAAVFPPMRLTPVGGLLVYAWTVDLLPAVSTRVGLRLTFPQAQSGRAWLTYQE
ncbi:MAG: hypothetical protein ACHQWU_04970 [Gemmatimonadales bacterium]